MTGISRGRLGRRLYMERTRRMMSLRKLGDVLGSNASTLSRIECHDKTPDADLYFRIHQWLGEPTSNGTTSNLNAYDGTMFAINRDEKLTDEQKQALCDLMATAFHHFTIYKKENRTNDNLHGIRETSS